MQQKSLAKPSVSTRTAEFTPSELPLQESTEPPGPATAPKGGAGQRVREALRRWFEQEM